MAFLDNVDKKLTSWSKGAMQKTKDVSDTMKFTNLIKNTEDQKNNLFMQLGKKYYYYLSVEQDPDEDKMELIKEIDQILEEIKKTDKTIDYYKEQLNILKGTMICPNCNAEVPQGSMFCNCCGTKMEVKVQQPAGSGSHRCSRCGAELFEGQVFCMSCGTKVELPKTEVPKAEPPKAEPSKVEEPEDWMSEEEYFDDEATVICSSKKKAVPIEPVVPAETVIPAEPKPSVCVNCGAKLEDDQLFCVECGTRVEKHTGAAPVTPLRRTCTNCGVEVEESQLFCTNCGSALR